MFRKSKMPVATAIHNGAGIFDPDARESEKLHRDEWVRKAARSHTKIEANVAAQMYWCSENWYDHSSDFPPLRLPYPKLWIEWTVPEAWQDETGWHPTHPDSLRHWFAIVEEGSAEEIGFPCQLPDDTYTSLWITGGGLADHEVQLTSGMLMVNIDENGKMLGGYSRDNELFDSIAAIAKDLDAAQELASLKAAVLAVGLMNCKNIHTRMESTANRSRKQQRRNKIPKLEYHTIIIPGQESDSTASGQKLDVMPLHKVRGHFKTYTPEKPLMGKLTGTYWWSWHIRGNARNGTVISDYQLSK